MVVGQIIDPELNTAILAEGEIWVKLGIQAPPHTKFKINDKDIIIGSTGIYELFEGLQVESLMLVEQPAAGNIYIDYVKEE